MSTPLVADKLLLVMIIAVLMMSAGTFASETAGPPSDLFNTIAAEQEESQWCWAACVKMILNRYKVVINQQDIVERTYGRDALGRLPDWPATFDRVTANLNGMGIDSAGKRYTAVCFMGRGAPTPSGLIGALNAGCSVLFALHTGPNQQHAVLCTAATYDTTQSGPIVGKLVIRDPWPSPDFSITNRREIPAATVASVTVAYWIVTVSSEAGEAFTAIDGMRNPRAGVGEFNPDVNGRYPWPDASKPSARKLTDSQIAELKDELKQVNDQITDTANRIIDQKGLIDVGSVRLATCAREEKDLMLKLSRAKAQGNEFSVEKFQEGLDAINPAQRKNIKLHTELSLR